RQRPSAGATSSAWRSEAVSLWRGRVARDYSGEAPMRAAIAVLLVVACGSAAAQDRAWIERSDRHSRMALEALARSHPEWVAELGLERYDSDVRDLKPGHIARADAALAAAASKLRAARLKEPDSRVREDLDIVIDALTRMRRTASLEYRL